VLAFAGLVVGCVPPGEERPEGLVPVEDMPRELVIHRVNANTQAMDFLLRAGGVTAEVRYHKPDGGVEDPEMRGRLLFRRPRDLYLRLDHLAGQIEVGSNAEEFWVWQKFDPECYWWGRHDGVVDMDLLDIPLRPDHLIEVLGFVELPSQPDPELGPVFGVGAERYGFDFLGRDSVGQLYYEKAMAVDRRPPYLVRDITYFKEDGHPLALAQLSDYRQVEGSDVKAPHRITVKWVETGNMLNLKISNMRRYEKAGVERVFEESPRQAGKSGLGEVIRVDRPAVPPSSQPVVLPES
jgi:hypothetical protein